MRTSRGESLLLQALDLLLAGGCMASAYALRFWLDVGALVPDAVPAARYAEGVAIALAATHLLLRARGLYDTQPARGFDAVEETWRGVTLASVVVLALSFFQRDSTYSRSVVLLAWALQCAALPVPRLLLLVRRRRRFARGQDLVPCLVVGSPRRVLELLQRLAGHGRYGLSLVGLLPTEPPDPAAGPPPVPWVGASLADLEPALARTGAREVLISDTLERLPLLEVLEKCERLGVEARVCPCIYDLFIMPRDLAELHGVALVSVRERRFEVVSRAVKRAFDLVAAGALLLLASPLLALLCLLIRRESPGPALFGQRRIGEAGRPFRMWKLRSMVHDAEARLKELVDLDRLREPVFKLENDPRVTRIGRWIRRWSLDELPQLWNVVTGDMSLVGPRPEEESVVARYDAHQRRRLKAKPGLTGLQQVEARAVPDLDERVRLDVYYIRRRTFLYDLWLLARTPWAVLSGRGAT